MTGQFPYQLEEVSLPTIGLIVLQSDETLEQDFRRLVPVEEASMHISRIPSGDAVTPETLGAMEADLTQATSLFPNSARFDVIGYACTSGTAHIGADNVERLVKQGTHVRHVTNPLTAALGALREVNAGKIGIVSPYTDQVAQTLVDAFQSGGVTVSDTLSFGEEKEANVARISPASIADAARSLAKGKELDAVFLSCTNLRTLDVNSALAAELGIPVLSSNQALAWHMSKLAGFSINQH